MFREYAYLNARVSVLATQLLPEERLNTLLTQSTCQLGIPYLDELLNDNQVKPRAIEHAWFLHLIADVKVLIRPLSGIARDLLMYWFHKCEITNLKSIIRGKIAGLDAQTIADQLIELGELATLPVEQLLRTEDINELLRQLEGSHYGNIARQARRVFEKEHYPYSLDAAIDKHYLFGLEQKIQTLSTAQYRPIVPLIRALLDRFNLIWLLRYRFAYHLSPAETFYLLISTPYRLNRHRLLQLVELNSLSEVIDALPEPLASLLDKAENTFEVEQCLNAEVRRVAQQTLHQCHFTFAKVFAYLLLRELEMRRVLAIIKGKRLGLDNDVISAAADAYSPILMV